MLCGSNPAWQTYITQIPNWIHRGNVILSTVAEEQAFQAEGYKKIIGNLTINVTTVQHLNNRLEEITGDLTINSTLLNCDGLYGLKKVGLIIDGQYVGGNVHISTASTEGLNNLEFIGGDLWISGCDNSSGLEKLTEVGGNVEVSFKSFAGLKNLTRIGKSFTPKAECVNFEGLENLQEIGSDFIITRDIQSFKGLRNLHEIGGIFQIGGHDGIFKSSSLSDFSGLDNLTKIGSDFILTGNLTLNSLTSFTGLEKVSVIGGEFKIIYHVGNSLNALTSFQGLQNLQTCKGIKIDIDDGGCFGSSLTALKTFSLNSLRNLGHMKINIIDSPGGAGRTTLCSLTSFEMNNLEKIDGNIEINTKISEYEDSPQPTFQSFGMRKLREIGGNFIIANSVNSRSSFEGLQSLDGLESLQKINGNLELTRLRNIKAFNGLENLNTIQGSVVIDELQSLNDINALNALQNVGGANFNIQDCEKLFDFTPLKNVLTNYNGTFTLSGNGYNPTKYQILNGQGKPQ